MNTPPPISLADTSLDLAIIPVLYLVLLVWVSGLAYVVTGATSARNAKKEHAV